VVLLDDAKAALAGCDVAIDFTVPAAALAALRAAADAGVAFVTGTTGLSEPERSEIAELASRIPVIHAPNFSLAVNVLAWLAREAARRLGPGFDAEIVELHHAAKRDAPSGTALHLGRAIAEGRGKKGEERLVLERAGAIGARPEGSIGIQTLRGGDNPGEHSVYFVGRGERLELAHFVGRGERLELAHRSFTRDHFARGAVRAAAWLAGRPPGLYPLEQILGLE
jgi:4-hydroxy-tetrahydrodipicolinate reductase